MLNVLKIHQVDIVFWDIEMIEMIGFETMQSIRILYPALKVIVLTMSINKLHILEMYRLGVMGYLLKNTSYKELKQAIEAMQEGIQYFCPKSSKIVSASIEGMKNGFYAPNGGVVFSGRELEILMLICQQLSSAQIADKLCISARTVDRHRMDLCKKTGVINSAGLIIYAIKNELIKI